MTANVERHVLSGAVALARILSQRLEDDEIQIADQLTTQSIRRSGAGSGALIARAPVILLVSRAGKRLRRSARLALADDPLDLVRR